MEHSELIEAPLTEPYYPYGDSSADLSNGSYISIIVLLVAIGITTGYTLYKNQQAVGKPLQSLTNPKSNDATI